ncbi:hypothetical protein [Hyalangium sp.]|uniref:hypothetical protein n=1 Tax=Hyalangium sp. TaxID=2028555 RepID=UPI002D292D2D|nr:hypothetical protein [Hyalangium sp.]HYI01933.1 hypothetical protein [Hyalangium sp.]
MPPGAIAPRPQPPGDCEIELITATEQHSDGHWELIARAKSWAATPIDVSLPATCPGGAARFEGLPGSYDYYGACAMGACPPGQPERRSLRIEPHAVVELARARVDPGGGSCNKALAPGRYTVHFTVELRGATTCSARSDFIDIAPPAMKAPSKTPPPAPPQVQCLPMPTCGISCDGPPRRDKNGCPQCSCADERFTR